MSDDEKRPKAPMKPADEAPEIDEDIPSQVEVDDQPLGAPADRDAPQPGEEAMPGIPDEGEPPASG